MKKNLAKLLFCLPATLVAADEYFEYDLYPDCRRITPAEVDPRDWFPKATDKERKRMRQNSRQHYTDARAMAERLLADPQDEDAFVALTPYARHINALVKEITGNSRENKKKLATLLKFRQIYRVPGISDARLLALNDKPRPEFIIRLRDMLQTGQSRELSIRQLYSILEHDTALNHSEIDIICRGLRAWCGVSSSHRPAGAIARLYLREFRGGREVQLSSPMEHDISVHYPHLRRFVSAECAINGTVAKGLTHEMNWTTRALNRLLWRDPGKAVILARHMQKPGYDLLEHKPEALRRYMRFCGIAHYRNLALEVPECCTTALNAHRQSDKAEITRLIRGQVQQLPPMLAPLAPRCLLALGQRDLSVWQPATLTPHADISPAWPDASAAQLPHWQNSLLGLDEGADIQAAFGKELEQLAGHINAVKKHRGTGYLLAEALYECERVRPDRHDLTTPVYVRIALRFEQDGITLSYLPEDDSFGITSDEPADIADPILRTALHLIPQHLHRLTLQLALLEKEGRNDELEQACGQLARLLNRSNLWPLVICQRELRGFSTRALLTLFAHYEGEDDALFDYGEAMGLRHEMSIARLGHEDELGDNLLRAAAISGALPATAEEKQAATAAFMKLAREHAYDTDPRLTGGVLLHLLRWGISEPIMQWPDCPARYFQGLYATNGLRLIRAFMQKGARQEAERLLAAMAADADTDTTPAYRLAAALLAEDTATAERLRKDALLMAMLHRYIDYTTYADYLAELAVDGDPQNNIMRSELMFSNGRSAGLSPELGFRYAHNGRWQAAHFVFEYMLTQGLTTITPYGTVPDHAHMYYYRAFADICRARAENTPELAEKALAALAGTPAEATAKELINLPAGNEQKNAQAAPVRPAATPAKDLLAALPTREWKLKNGTTLQGQLIALGRGKFIGLRLADGSARIIPMGEVAGNERPYFNIWSRANGIQTWEHHPNETNPAYRIKTSGRPIYAMPDFEHPGAWYMAVVDETGSIHWLRTWGLTGQAAEQADAFCSKPENRLAPELRLASTPQQALAMSKEHQLPILLISSIPSGAFQEITTLFQYLQLYPQAAGIWAKQYIILPVTPPMGKERPIRYSEQLRSELLELERVFTPGVTAENSHTARMLDAALRNSRKATLCLLSPELVYSYTLAIDTTVAPEELLRNGPPLPAPEQSQKP
ncbi:MAG: hypothetical protein IKA23_01700 [Akkermansia sp.]|nr:hypothetical protein [Akkermansia sp.]